MVTILYRPINFTRVCPLWLALQVGQRLDLLAGAVGRAQNLSQCAQQFFSRRKLRLEFHAASNEVNTQGLTLGAD
jgi:hypothetical protein